MGDHPEEMQGINVFRIGRKNLAIKDFGFGEAPVLMVLQGEIDWPQAGRRRPRAGRARGIPLRLYADPGKPSKH
jgi:hypothetical protein